MVRAEAESHEVGLVLSKERDHSTLVRLIHK